MTVKRDTTRIYDYYCDTQGQSDRSGDLEFTCSDGDRISGHMVRGDCARVSSVVNAPLSPKPAALVLFGVVPGSKIKVKVSGFPVRTFSTGGCTTTAAIPLRQLLEVIDLKELSLSIEVSSLERGLAAAS